MIPIDTPLVNIQKAIEHCHRNSEFSHWTWWFPIVFCMFTRGYVSLWGGHLATRVRLNSTWSVYPLVISHSHGKWPIEIDALPFLKMGGFSMATLNNQMVYIYIIIIYKSYFQVWWLHCCYFQSMMIPNVFFSGYSGDGPTGNQRSLGLVGFRPWDENPQTSFRNPLAEA